MKCCPGAIRRSRSTRPGWRRDRLPGGKIGHSEEIAGSKATSKTFSDDKEEDKDVGKRLDFLTQELNREANTITSKTGNMAVKENALAIKGEIEKIREQVQNVE